MTRFNDLTDAEVLALTEEQIAYHIDYECADSGAALLPPDPGPEPEKIKDMKDAAAFDVCGVLFTNREEALRVAEVLASCAIFETRYVGNDWSQQVLVRVAESPEAKSVRYYTANGWEAAKALVSKYNAAKKAWDEAVSEYNRIVKERDSATEWIRNRVAEVRNEEWKRQRALNDYQRYVELADGDERIARRFMLKAQPDADKYLPPLCAEAPAVEAQP